MIRHLRFVIPAVVVLAVWLLRPFFQPVESQVLHQHRRVLALAADRDWEAVIDSMALEYEDQWSMNRLDSVELAKEILNGFITLSIEWTTAEVTVNGNIAKVRGAAKLSGRGLGASGLVMDRVNRVSEPWVFTWRKDGRGPRGWKLLSLRNPGLGGPLPEDALRR